MGRLVGLELSNFKSYRGITKVGFGESNFTSIIGPNGSGKSNMMDAISFVLGVRSNHLRSNILKDLIYRGVLNDGNDDDIDSAGDDDAIISNPNSAYVKAFYQKGSKLVELTRLISRNGDTTYKIDGKTVTYKDYSIFLENENILIKAKNFLVFQGDVEQIAAQSPTDLSRMFEEVSGSIQYKKEYDELKEKIEKLSKSATESIKNRRRIHGELKTYKEGINKNEEYRKQVDKKNELQKFQTLWQLYHLEQKKEELTDKLSVSNSEISSLKERINNETKSLQRSKSSFVKESTVISKQKSKLDYIVKDKEKLVSDLRLIKVPQQAAGRRISHIEKRIGSLQRDIERQESYVERFETQLKVITKSKKTFEDEIKESARNYDKFKLNENDLKAYDNLHEKYLTQGGSILEEKISLSNNDKQEIVDELDRFNKRADISKRRITEELFITGEKLDTQLNDLRASLNEKNALHTERLNELKKLQSDIESANNQEYDLNFKLRETLVRIDDLSANQRETMKERKLRENIAMLKRFFPGVKGLVHDLCHPKKEKYGLAVSTILGRNFDSVIVENLTVAQECIAFLKKQRAGTASFIPLDTIETELPTLSLPDSQDYILSINAIDYEPEYEKAMQYVCGDSIICNTLNIAKDLKWKKGVRAKLVTIEGALIHKAGLMTGGISGDTNNRWDKEEYQSLMSLKDKLLIQIDELSNNQRSCSIRAREVENSVSLLNSDIASLRTQVTQQKRSLDENKLEIKYHNDLIDNEIQPKITELEKKLGHLEETKNELEKEKEALQSEVFKEFTEKIGFSIKEYESHSGELMRQQSKELQQLQKQILTVENKLQFETDRLNTTQRRCEKAQRDLANVQIEMKSLEEQEEATETKIKAIESKLEENKAHLEELQKKFIANQTDLNSSEDILEDLNNNLQALKRGRDGIKEDIEKFDLERVTALKNCKISNINLPILSETTIDDLPISSGDSEAISISNNIDVDYQGLPKKYKENSNDSARKELEQKIAEADEILNELQPNARAVERYDEAEERFDVINNETEELKSEEKKILNQFLKIKKKRKELFEKTFDYVSDHLDAIYRELTKNPNSTVELAGGNASLTIEDEDEPFNAGIKYHATPPLKRFKDMEYLSGGEKTVAALALLFAINSYQPSPFFVLDEVDAALDITNVQRIAAYIRRHRNPDLQFIVISLKNTMFEKSDALVGVYRQQQENSSKTVTLDLSNYAE
ncbi:hypothetical protein SEUBUCD646_0F00530 [Saccharomyces eubayanus]|uniref:Structural maintenance of chromosomes protein n=1 Tax=Saccharomyces eubayanus TaxID=1080349 RepID=A0ABN8VYI5_SACEU|nr:hypothetical protein SEUBUCD650_0F00520 [Saccharomyces eubayanus]CAI1999168.1 hypothetical protein SEUBUCD646_0F00530 [Saccharomyces eubayanus]